jgi:hypothetical protein
MSWLESRDPLLIEAAVEKLAVAPGLAVEAIRDYAGGDGRFGVWLYLVDKRCVTLLGLGIFDLEDFSWRDAYDSGESPKEALAEFISAMGYGED